MTLTRNQSLPLCWPTARAASALKELIVWRSKPWLEHPEAILGAEIQGRVQPAPEMSRLLPTQRARQSLPSLQPGAHSAVPRGAWARADPPPASGAAQSPA